jgi:hypothetical protein
MAIYRHDQAQLTFASEFAPGGYVELASGVTDGTGTATLNLTAGLPAGSTAVTVDALTGVTAGEFIQIGPEVLGGADSPTVGTAGSSEVRKVEYVDGTTTLYLDAPTAFFHQDNTAIQVVTAVTDTDADKYITFIPGLYESVDAPDPEMAIEPRYFLGTESKRNFYSAYKGQQSFTGSIGNFILLDGRPLRFPIGKVVDVPSTKAAYSTAVRVDAASVKGDLFLHVDTASSTQVVANGDYIVLDYTGSPTAASVAEVRKVVGAVTVDTTGEWLRLDYPMQYPHAVAATVEKVTLVAGTNYVAHHIFETVDLDSISWNLKMKDSGETAANDLDRRYYGGKVGSASLNAEEGGMVTMSWDGVPFLGMVHNQTNHTAYGSSNFPFAGITQSIDADNVTFPTTEPYYFSQGQITMFGQTIARVKSFNLSINNNTTPNYYISRQMGRKRGPKEIREQQREYGLEVVLALPDSAASNAAAATLFQELLLEGDYGSGMTGFSMSIRFDRGTNDSIVITIPDDGTAAAGGNQQGAFLKTAPHAVGSESPVEVSASILFRNLKIVSTDAVHLYP